MATVSVSDSFASATATQFISSVSLLVPPLDRTIATSLFDASSFLYTGPNPVQTGVAANTIDARHLAVLRGKVMTQNASPLPGVAITILNHPEFGQSHSRVDGMFDMVVTGGSQLIVNYAKDGYLPAQRRVSAPWEDYAWLTDVVLIPLDSQVTTVDLATNVPMQIARGSIISDSDGLRQATLLIPAGVTATMTLPTGALQPLTTLHVRATEYTVGDSGPQTMPGDLPPTSGYTYAVEFSVDEALAAGASEVRFSQPLINYVENYLGFPVGGIVPTGSYDRARGMWIPSPNGRVVQILAIADGRANLDTNGDSQADDAATLAALGVSDAERERLATLYSVGQTLWRVPIRHFSPFDCNWPYACQGDCTPPQQPLPYCRGKRQ